MGTRDVVVVGASTGGIEALQTIVRELPGDFGASVLIVLHVAPSSPNYLDRILTRAGSLPACTATDGQKIERGHIYVAPADHHLIIEKDGRIRLSRGPKENRVRPAIDVLFRSAAAAFGPRVIGVVLTGLLDDGTAGLWAIKERGGAAVVQNPEEAVAPSMPLNALKFVEIDHCVSLSKMAALLVDLIDRPFNPKALKPMTKEMDAEIGIALEDNALVRGVTEWGAPSLFACPECHGVLMQLKEGGNMRFRCHTGHAFSVETLLSEFNDQTEDTLWNAIRSIEETVLLMRQMANHLVEHGHNAAAQTLRKKAEEAFERSEHVREVVMRQEKPVNPTNELAGK
jgi:two-component system chemotaxis response regulator CheB